MRPQSALQSFLDFPAAERKLGAYRLVHLLGRGGFAPVWLAHEEYDGTVVRTVALKLFSLTDSDKPDDDDSLRERRSLVVKEAESLCRVEHPNIVKFFSLAIHETLPVAGLAMEHAKGGSVAERLWLRGLDATGVEGLPVPEVLSVALAVSSALAAIHEAGLVHQDIKPANVVATSTSFKVIDFGIAAAERVRRFLGASPPLVLDDLPLELHGSRMSDIGPEVPADAFEGRVAGTVGYVDPECVRLGLPANAQSDLYSLGALLYECITGYLPAVAGRPRGSGLSGAVLDGREAPPRIATIDDNLGRFRGPIGLLVDSLVSPSRSTRPHSAQTVAETIWVIARANDPPRHHLFLRDRVIPITPGGFVIGRGSRCDLPLKDDEASRLHAAIHVNGPDVTLEDLGSTNGVQVNGQVVGGRIALADADIIRVGATMMTIKVGSVGGEGGSTTITNVAKHEGEWQKLYGQIRALPNELGPTIAAVRFLGKARTIVTHRRGTSRLLYLLRCELRKIAQSSAAEVHAREEARRELGRLFAHLPSPPALTEEVVELPDGSRESYLCEVKVRDRPFWIARVPVTNALYERFDPDHRHHRQYDDGPGSELLDHHPVVNVDWHEATMFCAWLAQLNAGASLPATDDWALAAAGEDEREYPWGSTPEPIPTHANYRDAGIGRTSRVGSFPLGRGPSGTLDQVGNVWEWCAHEGDQENVEGHTLQVLRGGSWHDDSDYLRLSIWIEQPASNRSRVFGFRVAVVRPPSLDGDLPVPDAPAPLPDSPFP